MFRKMRRFKQQLSPEETAAVLKAAKRGVLSVLGDEGYPYGMPMDFYYDEAEQKIYYHGAVEGHKQDALQACDKASFCVWDEGRPDEDGWSWHFRSVIVFGRVRQLTPEEDLHRIAGLLGAKSSPDPDFAEIELRKSGSRVRFLVLEIEHMTGKAVHEN